MRGITSSGVPSRAFRETLRITTQRAQKGIMHGTVPWDELQRSDGAVGGRILVAILGVVYDASDEKGREFFGAGGPYAVMAGHDATFMIANMSLKPADADRFVGYDADDLQAIAEWIAYFDSSYGRYGWLVGAPASHGATLRDAARAVPPRPAQEDGPDCLRGRRRRCDAARAKRGCPRRVRARARGLRRVRKRNGGTSGVELNPPPL